MTAMRRFRSLAAAAAALFASASVFAAPFGGVEFPQGVSSFADAVTVYSPVIVSGQPTAPNRVAANSIGAPNSASVTLGDGGSITLEFGDNRLTGSGNAGLDLWIFEIGPDVEDTFVEISKDGVAWSEVGKVFGATSGIDIDAFGFGVADQFRFVRLTDDTNEGQQTGASVGADIDSVGAISSVVAPPAIPEPQTYALLLAGFGLLGAVVRRRRISAAAPR